MKFSRKAMPSAPLFLLNIEVEAAEPTLPPDGRLRRPRGEASKRSA